MTVPVTDLLRREAVEAHETAPVFAKADPMRRSLAPFGFGALLAAATALAWCGFVVRVDQSTVGSGRVAADGRSVVVSLPIATHGSVRPGQPLRLHVDGGDLPGRISSAATVSGGASASAIASAELTSPSPVEVRGRTAAVTVRLTRQRIWDVIAPARLFQRGERRRG